MKDYYKLEEIRKIRKKLIKQNEDDISVNFIFMQLAIIDFIIDDMPHSYVRDKLRKCVDEIIEEVHGD